jgi:hypothetical protein
MRSKWFAEIQKSEANEKCHSASNGADAAHQGVYGCNVIMDHDNTIWMTVAQGEYIVEPNGLANVASNDDCVKGLIT